jgi:hypothetical protein
LHHNGATLVATVNKIAEKSVTYSLRYLGTLSALSNTQPGHANGQLAGPDLNT